MDIAAIPCLQSQHSQHQLSLGDPVNIIIGWKFAGYHMKLMIPWHQSGSMFQPVMSETVTCVCFPFQFRIRHGNACLMHIQSVNSIS